MNRQQIDGPVLVADGADDRAGRGLMVISALHLAAPRLARAGVRVRVLAGDDPVVHTAVELLRWETGLAVEIVPRDSELSGAALFVAVCSRSAGHLPALPVPSLIAVQHLGDDAGAAALLLARAAHDPRLLAERIVAALRLS